MAAMVHFLREISSPDFHPLRVDIACEAPTGCEQVYRDYFCSKVLSASQGFIASLFQTTMPGYLEPPRTIMLQGNYRFGGE